MTGFRVKTRVEGLERLPGATEAYAARVVAAVKAALWAASLVLQSQVRKMIIKGPATGRTYRRRSVVHQASAPGEAPMSDTGRLAQSINTVPRRDGEEVEVEAGTAYAQFLEEGTHKMKPRPFMQRSVRIVWDKMRRVVRATARRNL